jgi:hypothetical protein
METAMKHFSNILKDSYPGEAVAILTYDETQKLAGAQWNATLVQQRDIDTGHGLSLARQGNWSATTKTQHSLGENWVFLRNWCRTTTSKLYKKFMAMKLMQSDSSTLSGKPTWVIILWAPEETLVL